MFFFHKYHTSNPRITPPSLVPTVNIKADVGEHYQIAVSSSSGRPYSLYENV
jgi:hypothetical protein